jgi:hypothetical protein
LTGPFPHFLDPDGMTLEYNVDASRSRRDPRMSTVGEIA